MNLLKILAWPIPFKGYLVRQLVALDQSFNTLLNGAPDETISSRLGRKEEAGAKFSEAVCDVLDVFEQDHCKKSIEFTTTGEPDAHHLTGQGGLTGQGSAVSTAHGQGPNVDRRGGSLTEVGR